MRTQTVRVMAGRVAAVAGAVLALGSLVSTGSVSATPAGSSVTAGGSISSPNSVDATTWPTTVDCAVEWHWVITGLEGSGIDSADVPSVVHVTWSDDSTTDVAFDKITGSTAHYLELSANLPATRTVKSASAVWPNPTDVTAYNAFNLSHGPCAPEETTTTVEETTTTVEETTTTVEETTTTAEETTTTVEETTTSVASEVPTTAGQQTTTTDKVESQSPGGELPATGSGDSSLMLMGGLALLAGGILAMALGRRTRTA